VRQVWSLLDGSYEAASSAAANMMERPEAFLPNPPGSVIHRVDRENCLMSIDAVSRSGASHEPDIGKQAGAPERSELAGDFR
jgi:hypothetical protein